ncbi:shikimate dehydrogenase [Agrococcus beijingensis]|uniref:shikimate dehydrogenase n=1 Tax=Agrococcus beijingensis TaxID=3068634 RepID=UPI00274144FE|nr:shikimate dehydrogenase [Agrococcus sp. REN33]
MAGASPTGTRRLAVLGSPIEHSLSPALHGAAARTLGLDWDYGRRRIERDGLADFVDGLDASWLGLSVTAPLKEAAAARADEVDRHAELTGAANTLLLGERVRGWNTDVGGIIRAFADAGLTSVTDVAIVGAGATALSSLVAFAQLGAEHVAVALRDRSRGERLVALGEQLGLSVTLQGLDEALPAVDAAVSTLPAAATVVPAFTHPPTRLLDADYAGPAGSRYAATVPRDRLVDGREMLLGQAVLQVRIFVLGDPAATLPQEAEVVAAMRGALAASGSLEES